MDTTRKIFANSQRKGGTQFVTALSQGACQPPKNITTVSALIRIMFMYSARKNSAKLIPEYSIMCPATISDSPSTTSNRAVGLGDAADEVHHQHRRERQPVPRQ